MKKTIILIALALLLIVPVFATTNALKVIAGTADDTPLTNDGTSTSSSTPKNTTVKIKLEQWPKYLLAITTTDYDGSEGKKITNTSYDSVQHVEEITMTVDKDTWTLNELKDIYYITYFAYENNQNVEYTIKLNGNMKLKDSTTATSSETTSSGKQDEIRYQMTISGIDGSGNERDSSSCTIFSVASGEKKADATIMKVEKTNLIGWSKYKSFALTLDAYTDGSTKDTVQNNIVGNYEGTVTLTIKSYS